jgi:hypothetical protein
MVATPALSDQSLSIQPFNILVSCGKNLPLMNTDNTDWKNNLDLLFQDLSS